jgi:adenosylhomocysteine nucleosidase
VSRIAYVTGLRAEAKIIEKSAARAGRLSPAVACAGASGERAQALTARLIGNGADLVISFGVCGGLDPALRPGTLIVAESICDPAGGVAATDEAARTDLFETLFAAGLRPASGTLLGSDTPVATAAEKARLFAETGAVAVDMESHGIAHAAQAANAAVLAVRAVADPAERDLPRAALKATAPDGRLRLLPVIATMYLRPWESPAMIRLAYEARLAFDALERAADVCGNLFGGD